MKRRIRDSGLPLREGYPDPLAVGDLVHRDLTRLIDRLYPPDARTNELDRETRAHDNYARSRTRTYIPRPAVDEALAKFAAGNETALVVAGTTGSGKTAALSHFYLSQKASNEAVRNTLLQRMAFWITGVPDRTVTIAHVVGASPRSADWKELVKRILGELKRRFRLYGKVPDDPFDLQYGLEDWLPRVRGKVLLILDGLDRLDPEESALELDWLPKEASANVRIIASAGAGTTLDAFRRKGWSVFEVPPLSPEERADFARAYLDRFGKTLNAQQIERIARSPRTADPMFLATLLDELRLFGFHENLGQRIGAYLSSRDAEELYLKILDRYEEDYERERPGLVREALSLLWVSRRGLSEAELLDLLGEPGAPLPRLYLAPFLLATEEWLVSRAGSLGLANEPLRRAVRRRYLEDPADERAVRGKLATYLRDRPISRRVVEELLWQQMLGELWEELRDSLVDFDRLEVFPYEGQEPNRFLLQMWEAPGRRYDPGERYLAAAERYQASRGATLEVADQLSKCGALLHALGRPSPARELCQRALAIRDGREKDVIKILNDLLLIGRTWQVENRLPQALETFERASTMIRKKYGKKSAEYSTALASTGGVRFEMGEFRSAFEQIDEAWRILEKIMSPDDPAVLRLRNNLSTVLRAQGDYAEAGRHARDVYEIRRRLHGDDHSDTASAMFALASVRLIEGAFDEALPLFEQALAQRERAFGPEHPSTLNVLHNLATAYLERREAARAKPLFRRAMEATKRRFGEGHPDVAVEAASLAECHRLLNEVEEAEELLRSSLQGFEQARDVVNASMGMHNLGSFLLQAGRPEEALSYLRQALAVREERLGMNHDDTGSTCLLIAAALRMQGDDKDFRGWIDRGMDVMTNALGPESRKFRKHAAGLARLMHKFGNPEVARYVESRAGIPSQASPVPPLTVASPGGAETSPPSTSRSEAGDPVRERTPAVFRELEILARTGIPPSRFFEAFLSRLVFLTGAVGGAVWRIDSQGDLHCEAEADLPDACRASSELAPLHFRFLGVAAASLNDCTAPPNAWMPEATDVVNPTPHLLRVRGLSVQGRAAYVYELAFEPAREEPALAAERNATFQRAGQIAAAFLARMTPADRQSSASSPPPPPASTVVPPSANVRAGANAAADEAALEAARREIRNLVEEVRVLAGVGLPPEIFLKEFLTRLVRAVGAEGGAIWNVTPIGEPRIEVDVRLPSGCRPGDQVEAPGHRDLIRYVAGTKKVGALRAGNAIVGATEFVNRTPYLLLIGYLEAGDQGALVCEIAKSDSTDEKVVAGISSFLIQMQAIAAEPVRRYYSGNS